MLDAKAGAIHYIVGQINDIYVLKSGGVLRKFSDLLERILVNEKNYNRILVFKENNGDLLCNYVQKININMSQREIDNITKNNKKLVISKTYNNYKDKGYTDFIINDKINKTEFNDILKNKDIKTAVIFPWEMKNYMNKEVENYLSAFQHNIDTDNIIIFQFHNIGQLDEFARSHTDIIPEYYLIDHSHKDNAVLENEYVKVLQDRLTLLNSVGLDEIKYFLDDYNARNKDILSEKDINKLALLIKNDMELTNPIERVIPFINYHSQMPLYAIEESLKNTENSLIKLKELVKKENEKEKKQQLIGIDFIDDYINEIKQSYDQLDIEKHSDYQLHRLNNIKAKKIPDYLRMKLNLILLGNPGTGKTTIARNYGYKLKELGLVENGNVVEASKAQLKGEYVGQSVAKTNQMIKKAQGGILFVDEIYNFASSDEQSIDAGYEQEIIDTILVAMTNPAIDVVFVFAGYETKSLKVIRSYEGLESRFGKQILLPDYNSQQFYDILKAKLVKDDLNLSLSKKQMISMIEHWILDYKMKQVGEWANVRTFNSYFYSVLKNNVRDKEIIIPESFKHYLKTNQEIIDDMEVVNKEDILNYIEYCKYPLSQKHLMICSLQGLDTAIQVIGLLYLNHIVDNPMYYYIDGIEELRNIDLKNYQFVIIDNMYKELTDKQCHDIYNILKDNHIRCIFIGDKKIIKKCLSYYRLKDIYPYQLDIKDNKVLETLELLKDFELEKGFDKALEEYYLKEDNIQRLVQFLLKKAVIRENKYQLFINDIKEVIHD